MRRETIELVHFNPRSPHGERRSEVILIVFLLSISIHAPRTGSDVIQRRFWRREAYFNPRSPHGERRGYTQELNKIRQISIHAPRTGSDPALYTAVIKAFISIHAPRTGSDCNPSDKVHTM